MSRRQYVELKDLEDWCFEQIVCADYPRKLTVHVAPAVSTGVFFKLYVKEEVVGRFNSFEQSLAAYNDL